ncbi:hypothetical protein BO71DRAFT_485809 [Aspergillus ellipticus CBS 707.79]|uniref:Uncharacterized protein n=1 Tax=Aspergillus ellipticus CBS 707.79 TaxID=1448320 RepID=A0A319D442_9EURO|nr:hypothetical protein BO71DRAFT_485809 [Aspergillus ellipticus CBS 707.79]
MAGLEGGAAIAHRSLFFFTTTTTTTTASAFTSTSSIAATHCPNCRGHRYNPSPGHHHTISPQPTTLQMKVARGTVGGAHPPKSTTSRLTHLSAALLYRGHQVGSHPGIPNKAQLLVATTTPQEQESLVAGLVKQIRSSRVMGSPLYFKPG